MPVYNGRIAIVGIAESDYGRVPNMTELQLHAQALQRALVNTDGGGLSANHPGMRGIFLLIEATRQLRGQCGPRQVKDAKLAVAHGSGGLLSSQATTILGR